MARLGAAGKTPASLRSTATRMLARREYGRAELAERLITRGAPAAEVATLLDEFERLGYLSDARFAQALVAQKAGRFGRRAIVHALKQKQVAPEAAMAAMATLEGSDELAEATTLWRRRYGVPPSDERAKARQVRFLMSRGYSLSIALKVLKAGRAEGDAG